MAKYKVKNTNILHNGKLFKKGSIIVLEGLEAERLKDFITVIQEKKPANNKDNNTNTQTEGKQNGDKNI